MSPKNPLPAELAAIKQPRPEYSIGMMRKCLPSITDTLELLALGYCGNEIELVEDLFVPTASPDISLRTGFAFLAKNHPLVA